MAKLRCCDITLSGDSMAVHVQSSKKYRQGDKQSAHTGSPTCPVAMLERYYSLATLSQSSYLSVFRGITKTKHGERLSACFRILKLHKVEGAVPGQAEGVGVCRYQVWFT